MGVLWGITSKIPDSESCITSLFLVSFKGEIPVECSVVFLILVVNAFMMPEKDTSMNNDFYF